MTLLNVIAFLGLVAGSFILLSINPLEFAESISKIFKSKEKTKDILEATNKSGKFSILCVLSFALLILGMMVAISMNNYFLIPILAGGFALLPFWYIKFTATFYKKQLNSELETALSVITTSYLRSESIITAVDENITYINPPVADVFKSFLTQTKLINSNIKMALENLKSKIDNDVFREWIDGVIACQDDKNLKSTLTPIVVKLSDMRIVSAELDYLLYEPMKEFITMTILLIGNVPLMYFLNKSWYQTLMFTTIGKAILAICILVIFISLAAVIKLTKPVEYKR